MAQHVVAIEVQPSRKATARRAIAATYPYQQPRDVGASFYVLTFFFQRFRFSAFQLFSSLNRCPSFLKLLCRREFRTSSDYSFPPNWRDNAAATRADIAGLGRRH